jgi:hypothetical protein
MRKKFKFVINIWVCGSPIWLDAQAFHHPPPKAGHSAELAGFFHLKVDEGQVLRVFWIFCADRAFLTS